jgi:hypothetical protein
MTELRKALFDILWELRRILGGKAAGKNLGGGNPADYLRFMLSYLGKELREPTLDGKSKWPEGRPPSETMMSTLAKAAIASKQFKESKDSFGKFIGQYQSTPNFPTPDSVLNKETSDEVWKNLLVDLVNRAYPSESAEPPEIKWLVLPTRQLKAGVKSPGLLLRADSGIVPFRGRDDELVDLTAWCQSEPPFALRCYTGAGGIGKTRLGLELCARMKKAQWQAGLALPYLLSGELSIARSVGKGKVPILVVIDYAEQHRDVVLKLVRWGIGEHSRKIRILLLSRAAGEWWQLVHDDEQAGGVLQGLQEGGPIALGALELTEAGRRKAFDSAVEHFAQELGRKVPKKIRVKLAAPYYNNILWVHMAALLAIEGEQTQGEYAILDQVLRRERRYWSQTAETYRIPPYLIRLLGRAVFVFTATEGAATYEDALSVLSQVPGFSDQSHAMRESVAKCLHECFPGQRWIEPLQPDRLGDRLVDQEMDRHPQLLEEYVPKAWRKRAL